MNQDYQGYPPYSDDSEQKSGFRSKFILLAIIVLLAVAAFAIILLLRSQMMTKQYNAYIAAGNQYYSSKDYSNAIVQYQKALAVDKKKTGSYINLSMAYTAMHDYDSAKNILTQGYDLTGSAELQNRLESLQGLINKTELGRSILSESEMILLSESAQIENAAFDMVAEYSFVDYSRDFGAVSAEISDRSVSYTYDNIGITTTYYDLSDETVLQANHKEPLPDAKPCGVRFRVVSDLFATGEEEYVVTKDKLVELLGQTTRFYQSKDDQKYYMTAEHKNCKLTIETDENGNIISESAWNRIEPLKRTEKEEETAKETGKVSGYIKDATTGAGMQAKINVLEKDSRSGTVLDTVNSASDGSFTYEGEAGQYTLEVSAQGYITEYYDIEVIRDQVKTGETIVLSPDVSSGEIRIVLTWGSYPSDLDSHTDGTSSSGSRFSIYYANRSAANVGALDVDDTSAYGPETTTITDAGANFDFWVLDYEHTGMLTQSAAVVKVYTSESSQPQTFTVPTTGEGDVWNVFRYENGQIIPVNTISY